MALTTSQLRSAWGPPCNPAGMTRLALYGDGVVTVDRRIAGAVAALNDVLQKWDYPTRRSDTGAYNCRPITNGRGYSLHAYAIALDINWQSNPYGPVLRTNMPRGMVDEITSLRTHSGAQAWGWGGNYRGNKDAMHFEVVCTPADIASGIALAPRPPIIVPPAAPQGVFTMFVVISGVAALGIVNNVLFAFKDWPTFLASKQASPGVPMIVVPDTESQEARSHFYGELLKQHAAAVR